MQTRPSVPPDPTMPADPYQPTRLAMPADPARHAFRPAQPSRPAGTCPLLRPRCRRPGKPRIFQVPAHQRQLAYFPLLLSKNVAISGDPSKNDAIAGVRICAHLHGLASAGAAEGMRSVDDGAAPAGSWQGWQGVEGLHAQELRLHAVHRERRDLPVSSLVRQSLVLGAMFACLSRH